VVAGEGEALHVRAGEADLAERTEGNDAVHPAIALSAAYLHLICLLVLDQGIRKTNTFSEVKDHKFTISLAYIAFVSLSLG
jgi:hypothetical protein